MSPLDDPALETEQFFFRLRSEYKPGTIRNRLTHIRAAYRYAAKLRQIDHDPTRTLDRIPMDQSEPDTFSAEEMRAIYDAIETLDEEVMFVGLAFTGIAQDGVRQAALGAGHLGGRLPQHLRSWRSQARLHRQARQGPSCADPSRPAGAAAPCLRHRREGQRYVIESSHKRHFSDTGFDRALAKLLTRAGVEGSAKVFRATFNSSLNENGAHERYVERIMGHGASTINRRHYRRRADNKLYETILLAYRDDPFLVPKVTPIRKPVMA